MMLASLAMVFTISTMVFTTFPMGFTTYNHNALYNFIHDIDYLIDATRKKSSCL